MKRKLLLACVATATVAATIAASAPTANASPTTTALPGFTAAGGVVQIEATAPSAGSTVKGARVALYSDAAATTLVRAIPLTVDASCKVTNLATVAQLLDISVAGAKSSGVYLEDNGLGNFTKGSGGCNNNSGRVTAGGSIVVKAGSALGSTFMSAKINIESKYGAGLAWTASSGGSTVATGTSVLNSVSDSGPDAGVKDNTLVTIAPPSSFQQVSLAETTTSNGTIALDDGGDAADGNPSQFFLGQSADYSVDCTDHNTVTTTGTGQQADWASFARLPNGYNAQKDPTCKLIGASVDILPGAMTENGEPRDVVVVQNTTTAADGSPQEVRADLTIEWRINRYDAAGNLRTAADINAELARQISFDDTTWQDAQWCGRTSPSQTIGGVTYAGDPQHPANTPWCVISDQSHLDGDYIVQTQVYHGEGDPKIM